MRYDVSVIGLYILDVLGRPVTRIPDRGNVEFIEEIRLTVAGTAGGTVRISDVAPGPLSSSPQRFARAGNRLYFSATDQVHGYELWAISDDGSIPLFLDGFENESTGRWSEAIP